VVSVRPAWAGPQELHLRLQVLGGFHVNAHDVDPRLNLIPTSLTVGEGSGQAASIDYPPGEERSFAFADRPLRVYAGEVTIAVRFRAPPTAGAAVRLALTYQACDENACLPPVTKAVEVPGPPG
jgi:hypothetical protein